MLRRNKLFKSLIDRIDSLNKFH